MKRYERILVCIEGAQYGAPKLRYVGAIARLAQTRELHVVHVTEETPAAEPDEMAPPPPDPVTAETLRACAEEHFQGHGNEEIICEVVTGPPLLEILRYAHDKEIDLIVIGRLRDPRGTTDSDALFARRLTRKATCSVLVLPLDAEVKRTGNILVPVRNSDCSANALEVAIEIAAATGYGLVCLNVFRVSCGYSRVGMTLEEHQAKLRSNAENESAKLLRRVKTGDVKLSTLHLPDLYNQPVPIILEAIRTEAADVVVIGARGRSGAAGVLLGKVTEQLIQKSPVPLLAVKKKGECIGMVQALLTIAGRP